MPEGHNLLWSSADLSSAFYLIRMPAHWRRFFVMNKRVPLSLFDKELAGFTYITCVVMPMGWVNSVSIFQSIHRNIVRSVPSIRHENEWRREHGMPPLRLTKEWLQISVDDFDQIEAVEQSISHKLLNTETELMQAVRKSYEASNLACNPTKTDHRL